MYKLHRLGVSVRLWTLTPRLQMIHLASLRLLQPSKTSLPPPISTPQIGDSNSIQINRAFLDSPLHQFETSRISHGFSAMNLSYYRNHTITLEFSCNLNWSIKKKSDVEKGDNRISVSKYWIISNPTLYPDCIKKLSFHLFSTDANSGATFGNDLQALGTLQHFICKNAMCLPKTTRSDICESLFGLSPISFEIDERKLLFFGRLCDLDTKTLTKQFYIGYLSPIPTILRTQTTWLYSRHHCSHA